MPARRLRDRHYGPCVAAGASLALVLASACLIALPARAAAGSPPRAARGVDALLPERMATTGGARQLIVVTGQDLGSRTGTVRLFERSAGHWIQRLRADARFGRNGLTDGLTRREGSGTTPTGIWRMSTFAFGRHGAAPQGCTLGWRRIRQTSWWSSEHDATYNTWVETTGQIDGEHLIDVGAPYEYVLHTGYNALPNERVVGRGSAIFIDVLHPGYTAGCVMVARDKMIALMSLLRAGRRLTCAIGTTRPGTPTSITAY